MIKIIILPLLLLLGCTHIVVIERDIDISENDTTTQNFLWDGRYQ